MSKHQLSLFFNIASDDPIGQDNWFSGNVVRTYQRANFEDAVFVTIPASTVNQSTQATRNAIIQRVMSDAAQNGTLQELTIMGHGSANFSGMENLGSVRDFLTELHNEERRTGVKAAHRIVFAGCKTIGFDLDQSRFNKDVSPLINTEIAFLRDYARKNQVEIVGTTTLLGTGTIQNVYMGSAGRYVTFDTQGNVKRDKLDYSNPVFGSLIVGGDRFSWEECHLGRSQHEGAQCLSHYNRTIRENSKEK